MTLKKYIIHANGSDPWSHLALEEFYLSKSADDIIYLLFYVNSPCVVIGKNQNPWGEVNLEYIKKQRIRLARRFSGGGAVFHDPGNLNYSIIFPRSLFNPEKQLEIIQKALSQWGIDTVQTRQHALFTDGKKISGNAFCLKKKTCCIHGTLLVSTDLNKLRESLVGNKSIFESKGVNSIPAEVTNLSLINSEITLASLKMSIQKAFSESFGIEETRLFTHCKSDKSLENDAMKFRAKQRSWEWRFGQTPFFKFFYQKGWQGREIKIYFYVNEGRIANAQVVSAGTVGHSIQDCLNKLLNGIPLRKEAVHEPLNQFKQSISGEHNQAIVGWIRDLCYE